MKKDKKGYKAKAVIEFIGEVKDKEGIFYGVSVDRAWKGKHNGTFKNIKYFETDQQRGLFITIDRISKFLEKNKPKNKSENKRISINDNVYIPKLECQGTVKFIGCVNHKPGIFYGISLQLSKGKNNGTIKGRKYFSCDQNCGIFLKIKEIDKIDGNNDNLSGPGLPGMGLPAANNDGNELAIAPKMPPPPPSDAVNVNNKMPGMPPPPINDSQPKKFEKPKPKKGANAKSNSNANSNKKPASTTYSHNMYKKLTSEMFLSLFLR